MIVFIFLLIILIRVSFSFIASVKANMRKLKVTELMEQRAEVATLELKIVALAQPLRCLEFMFTNVFDLANHCLDNYSQEQLDVLKKTLEDDYNVQSYEDLNFYSSFIQFKLLTRYFTKKELSQLIVEKTDLTENVFNQNLLLRERIGICLKCFEIKTLKDAVDFIRRHKHKKIQLADDRYFEYVELLYKAHIYSLSYEVGYLSKEELFLNFSELENEVIDWEIYDQAFSFLNRLFKTGLFAESRIMKKKNRICWGDCGVWHLQDHDQTVIRSS